MLELSPNKSLRFLFGIVNNRAVKGDNLYNNIVKDFEKFKNKHKILYKSLNDQRSKFTKNEKNLISLLKNRNELTYEDVSKIIGITRASVSRRLVSIHKKGGIQKRTEGRKVIWKFL